MGQSHVVDWLKSKGPTVRFGTFREISAFERTSRRQIQSGLKLMRYGGEFKFFGGSMDEEDETLESTAKRELREELLLDDSNEIEKIRLFNTKITKVIKGRSYNMHNFVALESENRFLRDMENVHDVNEKFRQRESKFASYLRSGAWWKMGAEERVQVSPETHKVKWWNVNDIIKVLYESKSKQLIPVNPFQRDEFEKYGIMKRDAMFQTMATLMEINQYDSENELLGSLKHHHVVGKL